MKNNAVIVKATESVISVARPSNSTSVTYGIISSFVSWSSENFLISIDKAFFSLFKTSIVKMKIIKKEYRPEASLNYFITRL